MTRDKAQKRATRARMGKTGESYSVARRYGRPVVESLDAAPVDVVGHVHGLVGAGVRTPASTEALAVLTEGPVERCIERTVCHRDRHGVLANLPLIGQRRRRQVRVNS